MAYTVETYMQLNIPDLERRFRNLELLVQVWQQRRTEVIDIMDDHKVGEQLIEKYEKAMNEYREDLENIVEAVRRKNA